MSEAAGCPFCGSTNISVSEGTTFRWMHADCGECGATGPEVRMQTLGEGTRVEWLEQAKADAIAAWNRRLGPASPAPKAVEMDANKLHVAILNLPCKAPPVFSLSAYEQSIYAVGHKDARHAAAELVIAAMSAQGGKG